MARSMGAKAWELRTATSLAQLHLQQTNKSAGLEVLGQVYERFTEGFATHDLISARALLCEMKGPGPRAGKNGSGPR